jgi:NAD(P)-dependent dehydrogenase (short-subunit alcohol dehydrogenase family)
MAAAGAKVVVNDLGGSTSGEGPDRRVADTVVDIIRERGGEAVANYDDVSDYQAAGNLIQQAVDTFGDLDALVLNAGILRDKMIFNMDEADWDNVIKVHLKGHFAPARHACVHWRERTKQNAGPVRASVICTSSSVGLFGNIGQTNYAAAKGGIAMFTIALAQEMERYGVRANCVAPSGNTRMIATIPGRDAAVLEPEEYEAWEPTNPGNVAPLVVWLASDLSAHVTGQVFMARGADVMHFNPWAVNVTVSTPGGDRKWTPEELNVALNTRAFRSRTVGLRASLEAFRTR